VCKEGVAVYNTQRLVNIAMPRQFSEEQTKGRKKSSADQAIGERRKRTMKVDEGVGSTTRERDDREGLECGGSCKCDNKSDCSVGTGKIRTLSAGRLTGATTAEGTDGWAGRM
jgi:hypothetical protein